ncbi:MAG: ribosome small subunit-dependent GTPase A [Bacteroidetes bacterium]|nr:MAG: ribosome small subunit-dependent GTPase A [Bacteroidota bacterium]
MQGRVIKSTGSWYHVETDIGTIYSCKLRGKFKIKGIKSTNPIAVGDFVEFSWDAKSETGAITKIEERKNYIIRRSVNLSKRSHIIASNMDQALLVVTLSKPRTSSGFIDRFLITSEAYHIPVVIVFNKIDIYSEKDKLKMLEFNELYTKIGYNCIEVSAKEETNLEALKEIMKNKVSLISGHSGVGKSALINVLDKTKDIRIGEISDVHLKGTHTTTNAEMHSLEFGAHIIDSPGIKEFGLFNFKKEDLSQYFIEMQSYIHDCKFNNCTHVHEPKCAVKRALDNGEITQSRYENYLNMLDGREMNIIDYSS